MSVDRGWYGEIDDCVDGGKYEEMSDCEDDNG